MWTEKRQNYRFEVLCGTKNKSLSHSRKFRAAMDSGFCGTVVHVVQ
ncbi:hypothetical protein C7373_11147 [Intestinimonas butyriciproducens]|uniref:Uncharacterized protein n=1 Tax=Intestinimonas butyriciproducens TaxID=1297617 RepID=A0A2U1BEE4_9FIRM|nr:hypothetical protein C7373_11147 [Intestinimonas butyriciproducens]